MEKGIQFPQDHFPILKQFQWRVSAPFGEAHMYPREDMSFPQIVPPQLIQDVSRSAFAAS